MKGEKFENEHPIDGFVRRYLDQQAERVDPRGLKSRILASLPSGDRPRAAASRPADRRRPWGRLPWVAAALVLVAVLGGLWTFRPQRVQADSMVRQSLQVHRLPVDRCYLVERHRLRDGRSELLATRIDLLWTRGTRFFWESSTDRHRWNWGRDARGAVWLAYGDHHGIELEADELPPWLDSLCQVLSLDMETLLGDLLQGHRLTRGEAASADTVVVTARSLRGRPNRWLKEATLEIDRQSRVVRRATVTRLLRGGGTLTTTFTLLGTEAQPAERYELLGHLDEPFEILTRENRPQRRQQILARLFGIRPMPAAGEGAGASPSDGGDRARPG